MVERRCRRVPAESGVASFPYFYGTGSVYVCRSVNRRNNEAKAHIAVWIFYGVSSGAGRKEEMEFDWCCMCGGAWMMIQNRAGEMTSRRLATCSSTFCEAACRGRACVPASDPTSVNEELVCVRKEPLQMSCAEDFPVSVGRRRSTTAALSVEIEMHIGRVSYIRIYLCYFCLLYTSPSPRDRQKSRMPSSA